MEEGSERKTLIIPVPGRGGWYLRVLRIFLSDL